MHAAAKPPRAHLNPRLVALDGMPTCQYCKRDYFSWKVFKRRVTRLGCQGLKTAAEDFARMQAQRKATVRWDEPLHAATASASAIARADTSMPSQAPVSHPAEVQRVLQRSGGSSWYDLFGREKPGNSLGERCALCNQWVARRHALKLHWQKTHPTEWDMLEKPATALARRCLQLTLGPKNSTCWVCGHGFTSRPALRTLHSSFSSLRFAIAFAPSSDSEPISPQVHMAVAVSEDLDFFAECLPILALARAQQSQPARRRNFRCQRHAELNLHGLRPATDANRRPAPTKIRRKAASPQSPVGHWRTTQPGSIRAVHEHQASGLAASAIRGQPEVASPTREHVSGPNTRNDGPNQATIRVILMEAFLAELEWNKQAQCLQPDPQGTPMPQAACKFRSSWFPELCWPTPGCTASYPAGTPSEHQQFLLFACSAHHAPLGSNARRRNLCRLPRGRGTAREQFHEGFSSHTPAQGSTAPAERMV